ncbi:MAG: hypothetical protein AB7I50_21460 [Vicinamibacterales bacterium]
MAHDSQAWRAFFTSLGEVGQVLSVKLYRVELHALLDVPVLPCLDHEAMLHGGVPPHAAAYVLDAQSHDLHELVYVPSRARIEVDVVSTWGECSDTARDRLVNWLREHFPACKVVVRGPSWWRGERRVAQACRAQVSLRDVLVGSDLEKTKADIDRLQTIGSLMEKESRVASWGVRTVTAPLLAAAGVVTFQILGTLQGVLGDDGVAGLRYGVLGSLGAVFLYYGLKAVQLTEMANRVWKRGAEYTLILAERRRLRSAGAAASTRPGATPP